MWIYLSHTLTQCVSLDTKNTIFDNSYVVNWTIMQTFIIFLKIFEMWNYFRYSLNNCIPFLLFMFHFLVYYIHYTVYTLFYISYYYVTCYVNFFMQKLCPPPALLPKKYSPLNFSKCNSTNKNAEIIRIIYTKCNQ